MSKESVDRFYERLGQDEAMQQDYAEAIARASLEAAAAFAIARGFDVSPDDLGETLQSRSNELSDDELGAVAGGVIGDLSKSGVSYAGMDKSHSSNAGAVLAGILDINRLRRK